MREVNQQSIIRCDFFCALFTLSISSSFSSSFSFSFSFPSSLLSVVLFNVRGIDVVMKTQIVHLYLIRVPFNKCMYLPSFVPSAIHHPIGRSIQLLLFSSPKQRSSILGNRIGFRPNRFLRVAAIKPPTSITNQRIIDNGSLEIVCLTIQLFIGQGLIQRLHVSA